MVSRIIIGLFCLSILCAAQGERSAWRLETGIVISHFQQQVKQAVGDPRGQRLVNEFQIGGLLSAGYRVTDMMHAGFFLRADRGERFLARFDGFSPEGKTKTINGIGGTYTEWWLGPIVQFSWRQITLDLGFAPFGARSDRARNDIPNEQNIADGSFSLHPTIAWLIALGGSFEISETVSLVMKLEYRPRYYSERNGSALLNNVEHGTQSVVPVVGISYAP